MRILREHLRQQGAGYLIAIAATTAAVLLRQAMEPWLGLDAPLLAFVLAVMVAAAYGGLWPGMLATTLGVLAGSVLFLAPTGSYPIVAAKGQVQAALFVLIGMLVSLVNEARRRAGERVEQEVLERRATEADLRRQEEQLREQARMLQEADRRKDEFLATLAHELRNPLAPICNALELIRQGEKDSSLRERAREMMERQIAQMVRLIDDLLDVSRITQGKIQLRKERVDLAAAVQSAVEAIRLLIETSGQELTLSLPTEPIWVDADPTRLAQVLSNLLHNAAKYTGKGGKIWLSAEQEADWVKISVRDTGIGIAPEHLSDLFKMFSQVAPALERSQGGLGIGLALAQGLVGLHGGTIEAHSAGIGKGSEFVVRLPGSRASFVPSQPPEVEVARAAGTTSRRRVLVVDDNRDAADSLALMLSLKGHEVRTAYDGIDGARAAAVFRPDVVFLDIGLPNMNGYEAAAHIRRQTWGKNMVLAAVTGWGQAEDKRRAEEAGFNHHLTKPVDPSVLETLLVAPAVPGKT
jgi:signal transduction histidine kinase